MPYPPIEPYDQGLLDVGDDNIIYWETSGNPDGKPALVVHGGPGSGSAPGPRRSFDPDRYRIVQFDQRGCGASRPHAAEAATDLSVNTTHHLIADIGTPSRAPGRPTLAGVRRLLGVDAFPCLRRAELRLATAREWCASEDAVLSLEEFGTPDMYSDRPDVELLAFVRLCTHYFSHRAWLADGALLRYADKLACIPGVLLHGRADLSGSVWNAWELSRAWPGSQLTVFGGFGHKGSVAMSTVLLDALDSFAPT